MQGYNDGMSRPFWTNGPSPGQFYNFTGGDRAASHGYGPHNNFGAQRSSQPITTGTSVIGVKFDGGVMIAADALVSYGSLARFQDVKRVFKVNDKAIIGTGGDFADFQSIQRSINDKMVDDICHDDTISLKPKSLYNWLTRILYNRRNKFEPLWLDMVVGGIENGEPFLGHIDLRGRAYEDDVIATGLGKHLVLPIVREHIVEGRPFTQEEATNLIKKSMEVLFYRDCRALSKYYVAVCTTAGANVSEVQKVNQNWEVATSVKGYS